MPKYEEIRVGDKASMSRLISEEDVLIFSRVTGDANPIHLDADYAARSSFGKRIVHGFLTAGLISAVLGMRLPGPGTIYLEQHLRFLEPVAIGARILAQVEVLEKIETRKRLRLRTSCFDEREQIVLDGEALVMLR